MNTIHPLPPPACRFTAWIVTALILSSPFAIRTAQGAAAPAPTTNAAPVAAAAEPVSETDAILARLAAERAEQEKQTPSPTPPPAVRGTGAPSATPPTTNAATAEPGSDLDPILARLIAERSAQEKGDTNSKPAVSAVPSTGVPSTAATPAARTTNPPVVAAAPRGTPPLTNYAIIERRNIFNPNRQSDGVVTVAPRMEAFSLTGTMVFEGGASYAFFSGTSAQFSANAISVGGAIAGFTVSSIRDDSVDLELNGETKTMHLLQDQMRRVPGQDNNQWSLAVGTATSDNQVRTLVVNNNNRGGNRGGVTAVPGARGAVGTAPAPTTGRGGGGAGGRGGGRGGGG